MAPTTPKPICTVLIPAKNEADNLGATLSKLSESLTEQRIAHEILVVNDVPPEGDPATQRVIAQLSGKYPSIRLIENHPPNHGIGRAIALGLDQFQGDCVAIVMADGCDDPKDLIKYYLEIQEGHDCVFGSRFMKGGQVLNYPKNKLLVNRLANWFLGALFLVPYQDFTNAFKMYSRETIEGIKPIISPHFGITVELPLKAIARGYSWKVVPNRWYGQKSKVSNLRIARMASRYLFIALTIFLERLLVRSDYAKKEIRKEASWRAS